MAAKAAPKRKLSVLKRIRQTKKRTKRNAFIEATLKTAIKKAREALASKNGEKAKTLVHAAVQKMDKAVSKGVIHKNTAARKKSRMMIHLNALQKKSG